MKEKFIFNTFNTDDVLSCQFFIKVHFSVQGSLNQTALF